jgi:hypothetical protein
MTPHEKAKDIYQKMFNNMPHPDETNAAVFTITKQCALIAVDEIIAANPIAFDEEDNCIAKQWWQEVKTEIELL